MPANDKEAHVPIWFTLKIGGAETAGFFKDAGLEIEVFYTEGGAQTIATVASGSVDIAMSNGILGAIGAYVKGGEATPYRIARDVRPA